MGGAFMHAGDGAAAPGRYRFFAGRLGFGRADEREEVRALGLRAGLSLR